VSLVVVVGLNVGVDNALVTVGLVLAVIEGDEINGDGDEILELLSFSNIFLLLELESISFLRPVEAVAAFFFLPGFPLVSLSKFKHDLAILDFNIGIILLSSADLGISLKSMLRLERDSNVTGEDVTALDKIELLAFVEFDGVDTDDEEIAEAVDEVITGVEIWVGVWVGVDTDDVVEVDVEDTSIDFSEFVKGKGEIGTLDAVANEDGIDIVLETDVIDGLRLDIVGIGISVVILDDIDVDVDDVDGAFIVFSTFVIFVCFVDFVTFVTLFLNFLFKAWSKHFSKWTWSNCSFFTLFNTSFLEVGGNAIDDLFKMVDL